MPFLLPKNTPVVAHFLNKNTIDWDVAEGLSMEKVKIELTIWGTEYEDVAIVENGSTKVIPKGYGENDWYLAYGDDAHSVFRHFKTNNSHDQHYVFFFHENAGQMYCDIEINGPDHMEKWTIRLDKKAKTNLHS